MTDATPSLFAARPIAALYVTKSGTYFGLDGVDPWDEERDARLYDGPYPVVAHPPCNKWAKLGRVIGRGQDGGCFEHALAMVRTHGGVLEHPAESYAWKAFGLMRPCRFWSQSLLDPGWVVEVDQSAYGFPTRKPTWLYYVGDTPPPEMRVGPKLARGCDALWSTERSKTPLEFRDALIAMARSACVQNEAAA